MHSVVATIQKEQDEAIRAPSRGATIIGGGPGTGKTVVALHRAAYLLYTDRRRFESGGVLVVGPSTVFMNYIERVLPSLGETSVTLRSLGEVVDGVQAARHDDAVAAAAKGSLADDAGPAPRWRQRRSRGAHASSATSTRTTCCASTPRELAGIRRSLLSGLKRNRAYARAPAAARRRAVAARSPASARSRRARRGSSTTITTDDRVRRLRRGLVAAGRRRRAVAHRCRPRRASWPTGSFTADELAALRGVVGRRRPAHRGRPADRRAALPASARCRRPTTRTTTCRAS